MTKLIQRLGALSLILLMVFTLSCGSKPKESTTAVDPNATAQDSDSYGICVIKIEEQTKDPKNELFLSMNKKMKCKELERCYHLVVEGVCDYVNSPFLTIEVLERNGDNFSPEPEKDGSYKYAKATTCVGGTYKADVWLQLKGTDKLEIKTKHYKNKDVFKADKADYSILNTNSFAPDFDAATGEVKGFWDRSSDYQKKLGKCKKEFSATYLKSGTEKE